MDSKWVHKGGRHLILCCKSKVDNSGSEGAVPWKS